MSIPASELESHQAATGLGGPGGPGGDQAQQVAGRSPTQLALARFRKDKLSMLSFVIVAVFIVLAVLAPLAVHFGILDPYSFNNGTKVLDVEGGGIPRGALSGISIDHWLGVEPGTGRDVASRLLLGLTFSLTIAISATILAVVLGAVLGIISGFVGGLVDATIGRLIDLTLSFPQTLMLLALSTTFVLWLVQIGVPSGAPAQGLYVILVLGLFGWPPIARIVRGQVLTIREREFVDAARMFATPRRRMYFKEILPNLWAPLLVYFTLTMPAFISAEAALAYLQVSVKPPTPTLGNILTDSISYSSADFFFFFMPAFIIAAIVVSFNLLGDGLRDALDPRGSR
jgi:peptide/nickel transport system permease protein